MKEAADRPDSPELARELLGEARALSHTDQRAEVQQLLVRSIAMFEQTLGSSHPELALPLDLLGYVLVKIGDAKAAVGMHGRAISIRELHSCENGVYWRFLLSRAKWEAGLDPRAKPTR